MVHHNMHVASRVLFGLFGLVQFALLLELSQCQIMAVQMDRANNDYGRSTNELSWAQPEGVGDALLVCRAIHTGPH